MNDTVLTRKMFSEVIILYAIHHQLANSKHLFLKKIKGYKLFHSALALLSVGN